ncbi:MAG: hemagglutinin repeat-containing protein, partial [Neisseriaceae bacterium]|nr:hemagglutinin repeat-containing protein [Neisseriaceae bacterium]
MSGNLKDTHDENRINAEHLTIKTGRDADISGSVFKADRIDGTIQGNLKLSSEQDMEI